jgi:hypothetical protein
MQSESLEQLVRHAVVPQTNGAHVVVETEGHEPAPLQLAAAVAVPEEQLADRQLVELPGKVHVERLIPSHAPAHTLPSEAHAGLPPFGAPLTAEQVPSAPPAEHDSH